MFRDKIPNTKKAQRLEKKGDRCIAKGKIDQALKYYEKSEKYDADRPGIYQKLIDTFEKVEKEWTQEDFDRTMSWTMRQQELEHPEIKQIHEKFTQEYQAVQKLLQKLMITEIPEEEIQIVTEILTFGEKAPQPILDFILSIKKATLIPPEEKPGES